MVNKETPRANQVEMKTASAYPTGQLPLKSTIVKGIIAKPSVSLSPNSASTADSESEELLGSLTTQQQQRTSARVIKKLRLDTPTDKRDVSENETPNKETSEKEAPKFPIAKQRMPKALWSTIEKNLFFEALNEYGKDFDAIFTYVCAKMKKKGMPEANLKTKSQVSHFYYRTWHKISKHVHYDKSVKKVVQELYALINYGELRRKLAKVNEKMCARLGELVTTGGMAVRARGRTLRVRTPVCRALRTLNRIDEDTCGGRGWSRSLVLLRARSAAAWSRVAAAAHNPRAACSLPARVPLKALIRALSDRWSLRPKHRREKPPIADVDHKEEKEAEGGLEARQVAEEKEDDKVDLEEHLQMEPERMLVEELKLPKKPVLHVGPRPDAEIHLPELSACEQLTAQNICLASYLKRMRSQRDGADVANAKIRTPKRPRKDSSSEKDKDSHKKAKCEEVEGARLVDIEDTAIDGIELMASIKNQVEDEEKPGPEYEKEHVSNSEIKMEEVMLKTEEIVDYETEKEKDSFSELEEDEAKFRSDTDNESDQGRLEKSDTPKALKNLKMKFRIGPKETGENVYTLVTDLECDELKIEETIVEERKDQEMRTEELRSLESKVQDPKVPEAKPQEPRIEEFKIEEVKVEEAKIEDKIAEEPKPDFDVDLAIRQIKKGWSIYDAGDLTIGDLYLMFGTGSKLELDYWWAEPTPPYSQPIHKPADKDRHTDKRRTERQIESFNEEDKTKEAEDELMSPKNTIFCQDSNDALSGDERKGELQASPESRPPPATGVFKLVTKLINRPAAPPPQDGFAQLSDRLKRLLALVGNSYISSDTESTTISRCNCGHVCPLQRKQKQQACAQQYAAAARMDEASLMFRRPAPIAPKAQPPTEPGKCSLEGVPPWRRGRPRVSDRRVVVQRMLPLLPKLPADDLIPVKLVPSPSSNTPPNPPRILPKLTASPNADMPVYYVMRESNGEFFYHDGERVPALLTKESSAQEGDAKSKFKVEPTESTEKSNSSKGGLEFCSSVKSDSTSAGPVGDISSFLPGDSMSMSPSRLLRDSDGWLDGAVQDFSLSSFLGRLDGRSQPDLTMDSQLHSLMAESSIDYVAKFADLAAEVSDDAGLPADQLG